MRDIEKELFLNNFDIDDYDRKLVNSIDDFESKIKGEVVIYEEDLRKMIKKEIDIRFLNTSKIESMEKIFEKAKYDKIDLSRWDMENVSIMSYMFFEADAEEIILPKVTDDLIEASGLFSSCEYLKKIEMSDVDFTYVKNWFQMFYGCKSLLGLPEIKNKPKLISNLYDAFALNHSLKKLDLSEYDLDRVRTMERAFLNCNNLEEVIFPKAKMLNLNDTGHAFSGCSALRKLDLSNSISFRRISDTSNMFSDCVKLEEVSFGNSAGALLDIDMSCMFKNCYSLRSVDMSGLFSKEIENRDYNVKSMFENCVNIESATVPVIYQFRDINKNNFKNMIEGCSGLERLSLNKYDNFENTLDFFKEKQSIFLGSRLFNFRSNSKFKKVYTVDSDMLYLNFQDSLDFLEFIEMGQSYGVYSNEDNPDSLYLKIGFDKMLGLSSKEKGLFLGSGVLENAEGHDFEKMESRFFEESLDAMEEGAIPLTETEINVLIKNGRDIRFVDSSKVTDLEEIFFNLCEDRVIDLSRWDVSNVKSVDDAFSACDAEEIILPDFRNNTEIDSLSALFSSCKNLKKVDLSKFREESIGGFDRLFEDCINLKEVVFGEGIFSEYSCSAYETFRNCHNLEKVKGFDFEVDMKNAFSGLDKETVERVFDIDTRDYSMYKLGLLEDQGKLEGLGHYAFLKEKDLEEYLIENKTEENEKSVEQLLGFIKGKGHLSVMEEVGFIVDFEENSFNCKVCENPDEVVPLVFKHINEMKAQKKLKQELENKTSNNRRQGNRM